jgi:two-component system nitrate/nitrite response regulator NarL
MPHALIVDDHPLYREGMISALRARLVDLYVFGANSAEEGLDLLERHPEIDVVLIDVRLPGMDGFAALAVYSERFPTIARIVVSGDDDPALMRRAFGSGASGYIPKSLPVDEVALAIQRVLAGEMFVPPDTAALSTRASAVGAGALTLRQVEALRLLGEGYTNKEIARALAITERTAKAHVAAIFEALEADNRTQAVLAAQRLGYLGDGRERS